MMLEFWKDTTDKNKTFGAMLTHLSNVFLCLCHYLLIAKLHACGLDISCLDLLQDYLSNRKQRTKVDSFSSSWKDMLYGVPQDPILEPLLLNIFMCDMLLILKAAYFTGCADDNTFFEVADNVKDVVRSLEEFVKILSFYFLAIK